MTVDLGDVKKLRTKTGAGIGDCKKALQECGGNFAEAEKLLKKQGLASAAKRSARAVSEGKVFSGIDKSRLVMVELLCETDFVAMNEQFLQLGEDLVNTLLTGELTDFSPEIVDKVQQTSAVLKENLVLGALAQMSWQENHVVSCYSHNQGKLMVAVRLACDSEETAAKPEVTHLCHDLALHVAAMAPQFLSREKVDQAFLAEQEEIFTALASKDGVPEKIRPQYVQGKLNKLLADLCLAEQNFVKSDKEKVKSVIAQTAKSTGGTIALADFRYLKVGASQEGK